MHSEPRLSIGLPVYNGEKFLASALESLLGQTYGDFELIISDNASSDDTAAICRRYQKADRRIRYIRQACNIGAAPNHNFVFREAHGELFKWASYDDLYAPDLLARCVDALDEHQEVILAHSWTAIIDSSDSVVAAPEYSLDTASARAPDRFCSMLFGLGGDDFYGVIRSRVLRRIRPEDSYHHADRTFVTELGLHGPFYEIPDWLYFRRDHPDQAERACASTRARCANLDPRRADHLRHPAPRLYGEYIWGYISAIRRSPLSAADRRQCYRHLARWIASRAIPATDRRLDYYRGAAGSLLPGTPVSGSGVAEAGPSGSLMAPRVGAQWPDAGSMSSFEQPNASA